MDAQPPISRRCPLCQRDIPCDLMERHHIKTKEVDRTATIPICNSCHNTIHALFSNKQIADGLDSLQSLRENEQFAKALKFIRKQSPYTKINVKRSKTRK